MNIIDISKDIMLSPVYDGDPKPEIKKIASIKGGDECNLSTLFTCVHTGTHCDSPLHYIENGKTTNEIELNAFIGECEVIEFSGEVISESDVLSLFPRDSKRILIKSQSKAHFDKGGAKAAANLNIKLIGVDSMSVGTYEDEKNPHLAFLENDIAILENLYLDEVKAGKYFLFAAPVKISGTEGAPLRAILIEE